MKHQHYINAAATTFCLIVGVLAMSGTNLKGPVTFAKSAISTKPQTIERIVEQSRIHPKDPVELTEFKVQGKAIKVRERFFDDGEWVKKISFTLKNKSSKTITYVQINIDFPETATSGIMMQKQLLLGRHPVYGRPTDPLPLSLAPNEFMEVTLASEFDSIKRAIERRHPPMGSISKILFDLQDVGFEDGTIYAGGVIYKKNPDSNSSTKWLKIE